MAPIPLGAITGLILSSTASYLITGRLFHPYQTKTPGTWRAESWRHHLFAVLLQTIAGRVVDGITLRDVVKTDGVHTYCGKPAAFSPGIIRSAFL